MTAVELLKRLSEQEVELRPEGSRLRYRAPKGTIDPALLDLVRQHKSRLLELLAGRSRRLSSMTLGEFARTGEIIRVRSRVLGEDVWWVSDEGLCDRVPDPSLAVYTAAELSHLLPVTPDQLLDLHRIKRTFDGRIEN